MARRPGRRPASRATVTTLSAPTTHPAATGSTSGTSSTRPASCPAPAVGDAIIAAAWARFQVEPDSDVRGDIIGGMQANLDRIGYTTMCLKPYQTRNMARMTSKLQGQARAEEKSLTPPWEALWNKLVPVLKVAAGGAGLIAVGAALVFTAGRNVAKGPVGQAGQAVAAPVKAVRARRSLVSDTEYAERRGMERAARQSNTKPPNLEGIGKRLPARRKSA